MEYTEAEELFIIFEYEMLNYKNTPTTYLMLESSTVVKTLMASSKDIFIHLKSGCRILINGACLSEIRN